MSFKIVEQRWILLFKGGYTSKLQNLEVGINKPFKGDVMRSFKEFVVENEGRKVHNWT